MTAGAILGRLIQTVRHTVRIAQVQGEPFSVGGRQFVPVSQSICIASYGRNGGGGLVWNRPVELTEVLDAGIYRHYPIRDVTLQALVALLCSVLLFRLALALLHRRSPE